jgi:hypothetical protein
VAVLELPVPSAPWISWERDLVWGCGYTSDLIPVGVEVNVLSGQI